MPNNITNRLTIIADTEEELQEVKDFLRPKQPDYNLKVIDFNNIIRQPKSKENDWYNWRRTNWGTKWNAYDQHEENGNEIWFDTAWESPKPIIEEIAALFPKVEFHHDYADENYGYNCGKFVYYNGEQYKGRYIEEETNEAHELFFELNPDRRKDFIFVNGRYERIED